MDGLILRHETCSCRSATWSGELPIFALACIYGTAPGMVLHFASLGGGHRGRKIEWIDNPNHITVGSSANGVAACNIATWTRSKSLNLVAWDSSAVFNMTGSRLLHHGWWESRCISGLLTSRRFNQHLDYRDGGSHFIKDRWEPGYHQKPVGAESKPRRHNFLSLPTQISHLMFPMSGRFVLLNVGNCPIIVLLFFVILFHSNDPKWAQNRRWTRISKSSVKIVSN